MKNFVFVISLICTLTAFSLQAEERIDLEGTTIIGNRELPKILYIVPWKKPAPDEVERPVQSLLEEILAPIDRDVFRRQVEYYEFVEYGSTPKD